MHLDIISRGSQRDVCRFIDELQGKYLPIKIKDKMMACNVVYRPIQLGEIIFPEPCLNQILKTLEPMNWKRKGLPFNLLRKMLKLQKVPEIEGNPLPMPIYNQNIELNLLGIKKDNYKDGFEQL
jgi:hypothetical protein